MDGGPAGTAGGGVVVCGDAGGVVVCGDAGGVVEGCEAAASGGFVEGCEAAASGGFVDVCVGVGEWVAVGEPGGDVPAGLVPAVGLAGPLVVGEVVHAETETETTTVKVAQAAK